MEETQLTGLVEATEALITSPFPSLGEYLG